MATTTINPTVSYDTSTPAGKYFATHQSAGDAWAQLSATLAGYGLSSLGNFVENGIIQGWDANQAIQHMRETPEYQDRFQAIIQRQKLGLPAISEADVVNTERQYGQMMQSVGLPAGFYDQPSDFTSLLVGDVSPAELQQRLVQGYQAALNAPPETKAFLQSTYGLTDGDLAAYYLDPDKTQALLTKQLTAAQIAGTASKTGFGTLDRTQAEGLVDQGVTLDQAQTGFNKLANENQLMNALPGEQGSGISKDTQLAAQFGQNAQAQQQIQSEADTRAAKFKSGGGFSTSKDGFAGLGTAR